MDTVFFIRICKRAALIHLLKVVAKIIQKAKVYQQELPLFFPLVASIRELKIIRVGVRLLADFFRLLRRTGTNKGSSCRIGQHTRESPIPSS